jgi:PST family polysaccharide transporter
MAEVLNVKVGRGVGWSALDQLGQEIIRFGALVVLSRLLTPTEFGLVALLTVFTGFVGMLAEFQIANAVVQKPQLSSEFLDTAFWANLALGTAMFFLTWFGAPLLAFVYTEPKVTALARVTAASFIVAPFGGVPGGLLLRQLDFKRIALRNIVSTATSLSTTAVLAYRGVGEMSLAIGSVAGTLTSALLALQFSSWRPGSQFRRECWSELLSFSGKLTLSNTIGYWSRNFDQFIIGSLAGDHALGLYSRSMSLLLLPLRKIAVRVDAVMFPAFATIQDDPSRIAVLYLRSTRMVALVTTPISLGASVVAADLVPVIFGPNWSGMIPLVQILAPLGALQSVLTMGSAIYLARGRADLDLRITTWCTLACSLFVLVGMRLNGVAGVAVGYALFSLLASPFIYLAGARQVGLGFSDQATNLGAIFLAAALMAAGVAGLQMLLNGLGHFSRLALCVAGGVGVYWGLVHLAKVRAYVDITLALRTLLANKDRPAATHGGPI